MGLSSLIAITIATGLLAALGLATIRRGIARQRDWSIQNGAAALARQPALRQAEAETVPTAPSGEEPADSDLHKPANGTSPDASRDEPAQQSELPPSTAGPRPIPDQVRVVPKGVEGSTTTSLDPENERRNPPLAAPEVETAGEPPSAEQRPESTETAIASPTTARAEICATGGPAGGPVGENAEADTENGEAAGKQETDAVAMFPAEGTPFGWTEPESDEGHLEAAMETAVASEPQAEPEIVDAGEPTDTSTHAPAEANIENDPVDEQPGTDTAATLSAEPAPNVGEAEPGSGEDGLEETAESGTQIAQPPGPAQAANHRDRRGKKRASPSASIPLAETAEAIPAPAKRPPAEARLRLALHPIRRAVTLSLVLSRPEGFPDRTTILIEGGTEVGAYDEHRFDDLEVAWTKEFLAGEIRVDSAENFQWLRSGRRIHIFAGDPREADLLSVSAVRVGVDHAVICPKEDAPAVRAIARSAGSPELVSHDHWQGVPSGWSILSGYVPVHKADTSPENSFRPLDPGVEVEIVFARGLAIRSHVFAEGHPPRIEIHPVPEGASVSIGGAAAHPNGSGAWEAPGWNAPGQHTVDVVPGPSLTYEIAADPAHAGGWPVWNAHEGKIGGAAPWARAQICGARVLGPAGELVLAAEAQPTMIALGASRGSVQLQHRADAGASVALLPEPPAFLFSSSGQRRKQGKVIWLGLAGKAALAVRATYSDLAWAGTVHIAASRRVPLEGANNVGRSAWRRAVLGARSLRRRCR